MGRLSAVTIDAFGTLLELEDPVPALAHALRARGAERPDEGVARGFREEMTYYRDHAVEGRDAASLAALRRNCAAVFLAGAGADLDAGEFAPAFMGALRFRPLDGVEGVLDELAARGLRLAVVSNWDAELPLVLERLGLGGRFAAVVTSAEAGAPKPDPRIFRLALERLGVAPEAAVHVGDDRADEEGAHAAGIGFVQAPLSRVLEAVA